MAYRQRDKRIARALTRLQQLRRPATAFEIGTAAIEGERRAKWYHERWQRADRYGYHCRASAVRTAGGNVRQSVPANSHSAHRSQGLQPSTYKEYSKCGLI